VQHHPALPTGLSESGAAAREAGEVAAAFRNALKLGSSLIATWSVAMIVKLQVPAHLGPVRQGHFGFAESFATVFFTCIGLGIDTYILKEVSVRPGHASDVVGGTFALRGLMSAAILAAMTATLWITHRPAETVLTAGVFGFAYVVMTNNSTLAVVLQAAGRVGWVAASNVTTKIVWGLGLLLGLHFDAPLPLLAAAYLSAELLKTVLLVPAARREAGLRYRIDASAVRKAVVASVPYFVNALALGVLGNLGLSVLEFVGRDESEVGWFAADLNMSYLCMLLTPLLGWVVMPMLSRAYARSEAEGFAMLRRILQGLVIVVAPLTVLTSAGADVLVRIAFHDKFAPAATGLSILSLVFVMTYLDTMLAIALTIVGRGWSVTLISVSSVFINAALMLAFVPMGRRLLGTGGECAGAAAAVIATEVCVLIGMVSRFKESPLDKIVLSVLAKSVVVGAVVLWVDRQLRGLGSVRLALDALLYTAMALGLRVVTIAELRGAYRLVRSRGATSSPPPGPRSSDTNER
jgi:O-antigen/teichoic acid export membrane protein